MLKTLLKMLKTFISTKRDKNKFYQKFYKNQFNDKNTHDKIKIEMQND